MARAPRALAALLVALVILPFWTSFLIRVYAWIAILQARGPAQPGLLGLGLIGEPLEILNTERRSLIGLVYAYLPFMVLPLYAVLEKLDQTLIEAAARPRRLAGARLLERDPAAVAARRRRRGAARASSRWSASSSSPTCSAGRRR